jgi:hypothetical protein
MVQCRSISRYLYVELEYTEYLQWVLTCAVTLSLGALNNKGLHVSDSHNAQDKELAALLAGQ